MQKIEKMERSAPQASGISCCPTSLPNVGSVPGPIAVAPAEKTANCHVINLSVRFEGSIQFSKPANRGSDVKYTVRKTRLTIVDT